MADGPSFGAKETASAGGLLLAGLAFLRYLLSFASPEQRRIDAEQREELRKRIEHLSTELDAAEAQNAGLQKALSDVHAELREEKESCDDRDARRRARIAELEQQLAEAVMNSCENATSCAKRQRLTDSGRFRSLKGDE